MSIITTIVHINKFLNFNLYFEILKLVIQFGFETINYFKRQSDSTVINFIILWRVYLINFILYFIKFILMFDRFLLEVKN